VSAYRDPSDHQFTLFAVGCLLDSAVAHVVKTKSC